MKNEEKEKEFKVSFDELKFFISTNIYHICDHGLLDLKYENIKVDIEKDQQVDDAAWVKLYINDGVKPILECKFSTTFDTEKTLRQSVLGLMFMIMDTLQSVAPAKQQSIIRRVK